MLELSTPEAQFIYKLLQNKSLKEYFEAQTRGICTDIFTEDIPREVWTFILEYVTKYNKLPTFEAVRDQVPLFTPAPVPDEFEYYRDRLVRQSQRNYMAKFVADLARMVQDDDSKTIELIGKAYQDLIKGARLSDFGRFRDMEDRIREYERKLIENIPPMGIPTGIPELDEHFLGYRPGDYGIICGRMGEGKTTVALFMAFSAFMIGHKVSYVTLEMPREQVFEKLDALATGISINKIKRLTLTQDELAKYQEKATAMKNRESDILIHDRTGNCSIITIEAIMNQDEPDILYIDSIYLMRGISKGQSDWERIKEISNGLKQLAMKYRRPIVVLSQVNRAGEEEIRNGRLPSLAHLSYSDSVGQDVDHAFVLTSNEKTRFYHAKRFSSMKLRGAAEKDIVVRWEPTTNFIEYLDEYKNLRMPDSEIQEVIDLQNSHSPLDAKSIKPTTTEH